MQRVVVQFELALLLPSALVSVPAYNRRGTILCTTMKMRFSPYLTASCALIPAMA